MRTLNKLHVPMIVKSSGLFALSALLFFILITVQSCNKGDDVRPKLSYLDVRVPSDRMMTLFESRILQKAQKRLEKYLSVENGLYKLRLTRPETVNISKQLFQYLKGQLDQTNNMILRKQLVMIGKNLIPARQVNEKLMIGVHKLNSDGPIDIGGGNSVQFNPWGITVNLTHLTTLNVMNGYSAAYSALALSPTIYLQGLGVIVGLVLQTAKDYYVENGNTNGISVHVPWLNLLPGENTGGLGGVSYSLRSPGNGG